MWLPVTRRFSRFRNYLKMRSTDTDNIRTLHGASDRGHVKAVKLALEKGPRKSGLRAGSSKSNNATLRLQKRLAIHYTSVRMQPHVKLRAIRQAVVAL